MSFFKKVFDFFNNPQVKLLMQFVVNLAFAVYNGVIAIVIRSIWFGSLATYYILLILLRGGIFFYHTRRQKAIRGGQSEEKTFLRDTRVYGNCGIILVLMLKY